MKEKPNKPHIVEILFVLALFGAFTLCALVLIVLGANVYKNTTASMTQNYETRTACAYITEKVRQLDDSGNISVETFEGVDALAFHRTIYDSLYTTYIYCYDDELRELFMRNGSNIGSNPLEAGTVIMELQEFHPEYINERLIKINLTTKENDSRTTFVSLHSVREEVAP